MTDMFWGGGGAGGGGGGVRRITMGAVQRRQFRVLGWQNT